MSVSVQAVRGPAVAPVRGTQSFVGVMVSVFKRPSLTGLELLWRWLIGLAALAALWLTAGAALGSMGIDIQSDLSNLSSISVFQPAVSAAALDKLFALLGPVLWPVLRWLLPVILLASVVACAWARTAILRRLDARLSPRLGAMLLLGFLRALTLVVVLSAWLASCIWAVKHTLILPATRREDPNLVLASALIVSATLVLFVLWCMVSWVLQLAPVLAMARSGSALASLRATFRAGALRGKLIEINLVMGIVKVALVVLAMVFSACPLPFSSVETQSFLTCWWMGVGVLYLIASDYFHVVRLAAYLALWRAYEFAPEAAPPRT